jgi:hypothetical protein
LLAPALLPSRQSRQPEELVTTSARAQRRLARVLLHNALMRKCNNAQRIEWTRLFSRKLCAYYARTRVWGGGQMNGDLRGRCVANAGGKRAASVRARRRLAQVLLARKQHDQHTASQTVLSLLPSTNGDQQLPEHDCGLPGRGRSPSFAA